MIVERQGPRPSVRADGEGAPNSRPWAASERLRTARGPQRRLQVAVSRTRRPVSGSPGGQFGAIPLRQGPTGESRFRNIPFAMSARFGGITTSCTINFCGLVKQILRSVHFRFPMQSGDTR